MSRTTRFQFLASIFKPERVKKEKAELTKRKRVKPKRWRYAAPVAGMSGTVVAFTRSEARSEIKKRHGLKKRVPIGAVITQVA